MHVLPFRKRNRFSSIRSSTQDPVPTAPAISDAIVDGAFAPSWSSTAGLRLRQAADESLGIDRLRPFCVSGVLGVIGRSLVGPGSAFWSAPGAASDAVSTPVVRAGGDQIEGALCRKGFLVVRVSRGASRNVRTGSSGRWKDGAMPRSSQIAADLSSTSAAGRVASLCQGRSRSP